jgi:lipase
MTNYRTLAVPLRGGDLAVGVWGPDDAPTVLALHGITASHRAWSLVAEALPNLRIVAPDLRGRARSRSLPGPWGMSNHADDVVAILDAIGVESAVVAAHSMGAFVGATLARQHPHRVSELILIDGGLPIPLPDDVAPNDLAEALIGPAVTRLSMTFESVVAYREFWKQHPGLAADWSDSIEQYVDYDLVGVAPELTSSSLFEAVSQDAVDLGNAEGYVAALAALATPLQFVRAPRGFLNDLPGLYPVEAVEEWKRQIPNLETLEIPDVNHYTIIMAQRGASAIGSLIERTVARSLRTAQVR